jgi:transposase
MCSTAGGGSSAKGRATPFPDWAKARWDETQQAKLERKIGQQTLEIDFLKKCLQRIEEQRMLQVLSGKPLSTGRSKSKSGGKRP